MMYGSMKLYVLIKTKDYEDMHGNAKVNEVKYVNKPQENSDAHVADSSLFIDKTVSISKQMGCEGVQPEGLGLTLEDLLSLNLSFCIALTVKQTAQI